MLNCLSHSVYNGLDVFGHSRPASVGFSLTHDKLRDEWTMGIVRTHFLTGAEMMTFNTLKASWKNMACAASVVGDVGDDKTLDRRCTSSP